MLEAYIEFGATFLGVLLAFGLALWYDRRKRYQEETATRLRILKAIRAELDYNLSVVRGALHAAEVANATVVHRFSTVALDSAVGGGHLSLLDPDIQTRLASIYHICRIAEMWSNKILSMVASVDMAIAGANQNLQYFRNMLSTNRDRLESKIPEVLPLLDQRIKALEPDHRPSILANRLRRAVAHIFRAPADKSAHRRQGHRRPFIIVDFRPAEIMPHLLGCGRVSVNG